MVTKFRDLQTGEDVAFNKFGGLARTPQSFNGKSNPGVLKFGRGALGLLTPQQLADLKIEAYEYVAPEPAPAPAPSTDPADWPLSRWQLRRGLLAMGITDATVLTAINEIEDAIERAAALIDWQDAKEYNFDHPLVQGLIVKVGIPLETAKQAWLAAKDLG